jgi:hypothetical protein
VVSKEGCVFGRLTSSLKRSEQNPQYSKRDPMPDKSHSENTYAPGDDKAAKPYSGADAPDDEVRGELEERVRDEEEEEGDVIPGTWKRKRGKILYIED